MATEFTQDSVLHFLRSGGGSVKNSDLVLHFRNFVRDHPDRDRNREHFKKFVNSVATVQQLGGVSYVVLRRKFRGRVPAGGEGGSAGRSRDSSPGNARGSPARQRAPHREAQAPAPPGEAAMKTVLPAAGIMLNNNNNNVEANLNLQPEVHNPAGAPSAAQHPGLSPPYALDQSTSLGQNRVSFNPPLPGITPVVAPVKYHGETRQQIPAREPLRGREPDIRAPVLTETFAPPQRSRLGQNQVGFNPPIQEITPVIRHGEMRQQIPVQEPLRGKEPAIRNLGFSEPPAPDQGIQLRHKGMGINPPPPGITPVVAPARYQGETWQQIPVQEPYRGRGAELRTQNLSEYFPPDQGNKSGPNGMSSSPQLPRIAPVIAPNRYQGETRQQIPVQEPFRDKGPELRNQSLSEPFAPDQSLKSGQNRVGFAPLPTGITPAVAAVGHKGEARQQIPVQEPLRGREAELRTQSTKAGQNMVAFTHLSAGITPDVPRKDPAPIPDPLRGKEAGLQPEGGLNQEPQQAGFKSQVAPRRARHRKSYKSAVSYDEDENEEEEEEVVQTRRGSAGGEIPLSVPLGIMGKEISASTPCIIDVAATALSDKNLPKIYVQDLEEEMLPPRGGRGWESGAGLSGEWAGPELEPGFYVSESSRRSLPLETQRYTHPPQGALQNNSQADRRYSQPAGVHMGQRWGAEPKQRAQLSSSTGNILATFDTNSSSRDRPIGSPGGRGWNSSCEDLHAQLGRGGSASDIQEVLIRAQRSRTEVLTTRDVKIQAPWHRSMGDLSDEQHITAHVKPRHQSTGDLYDDHEEAELSEDSTSSPPQQPRRGVPRRISSKLRSRMCRSMGADLDQLMQEEARGGGSEMARLNRLHLISSTLSLRYDVSSSSLSSCSTPPRSNSLASLTEGGGAKAARRSLPVSSSAAGQPEGSGRQSVVPLESREHEWLVKSAAGAWTDIYSLFREDSSLLNRRDFISGFTVLHWIAKHGDHRVLNTLWYGVQKAGLSFDINSRSTCGHTALHIAAIHGHKNVMRLLVSKFSANLKLRDTAGKKPWQYLSPSLSPDVFQLLGAPARAALGGGMDVGQVDPNWKLERHEQRRRRKHHLSSASSGERPLGISAKVKRSSSIAAFLKHKSFRHLHGHQSDSSI